VSIFKVKGFPDTEQIERITKHPTYNTKEFKDDFGIRLTDLNVGLDNLTTIGGGLYIYYHLEREKLSPIKGGLLLFLAFFLTGWSVVTRYTNFPVAAVLALQGRICHMAAHGRATPAHD
jgi:hypothetical protein